MKHYRAEVHGSLIVMRVGDLGGQEVLVDGRPVSRKPLAGWLPSSPHRFELEDEAGRTRHVEVFLGPATVRDWSSKMIVMVDGVERCRLQHDTFRGDLDACTNCGYSLRGLTVENGEVRCPECGRHTSARMLGRHT